MNPLNNKIIEDALATIGETDYRLIDAGDNGFMVARSRKRSLEQGTLAYGMIEFDTTLDPEGKIEALTKWVIDSFFVTFRENNIVNVDGGNGSVDINLAEPNSLQQFAEALKSGFKAIDAFYEQESGIDGSNQ